MTLSIIGSHYYALTSLQFDPILFDLSNLHKLTLLFRFQLYLGNYILIKSSNVSFIQINMISL